MSFLSDVLTGEWRLKRERVRTELEIAREARPVAVAMAREHAMRMKFFAGAHPGTARKHPRKLSGLEDYTNAAERIVLIKCARELEEDGGFFDGILHDFQTYVIGDSLTYMPNTGNPEADKVIRDYLDWQFDQCDYSGREDLTKLAQLAIREMKRDGEMGFVPVDVGDSIKLHAVPGDCIGDPYKAANLEPYNFGGIIVDPNSGRPRKFQIYRRIPKREMYELDQELTADEEFFHYCDRFRIAQYHGFSVFKTAIRDGFDIDEILNFAKLNMKYRASQLPTVHTESGKAPLGPMMGYAPTTGAPSTGEIQANSVTVDGVVTHFLKAGDSVIEFPNDFPNAQLKVSIEEFRRQCCRGADLPYEFVYASEGGGVVQRFWVNKAEQSFEKDKHLAKRKFLNPYKNRCIDKGIQTGELDLSRFGNLDVSLERFRGAWQMGKLISVDYGKENDTDIALIDAGLMSQRDKTASMGLSLDAINSEKDAQARKIFDMAAKSAKDYGLPIETVLPYYDKKFPNQASVSNQPKEPDPNAEAIEKVQEKTDEIAEELRTQRHERMVLEANRKPVPPPPAPNVTVHNQPPAVTVQMGAIEVKTPDVKVEHHSHVAAARPAKVTITNQIPEQKPMQLALPDVVVNVPQQPAPVVNVQVPPLNATLKIDRDSGGKMTGGKITD